MSATPDIVRDWKRDWLFLLPCLAVALLVRLYFFNGPSLHDDVNYWMQATATGLGGDWPPLKYHWHTRLGFVLPCAALLKVFGLHIWTPYVFTMAGGLAEVVVTFYIARRFTLDTTARLAAWLCVFFPLNILYSSYLYVDIWAGVLGALSLYYWQRALKLDRIRYYLVASIFFGVAWVFRETIVMCVPIFLVLWAQAGWRRSGKLLWVLLPGLLIFAGESLLYQISAGNWHYRLDAIVASRGQLYEDLANVRNFWLQPFMELLKSHELGLFMIGALFVAVGRFSQLPRPLVLWLLAGFVWFSWGTTQPTAWVPMQGDPRYLTVLTIPCLTLLAAWLTSLRSSWWRRALVGVLIASGLMGAALDIGHDKLSAYRKFTESEYNQPATVLEPFVYFGARVTQNFSPTDVRYACANDLGRITTIKQIHYLPGTRLVSWTEARYLVLSVQIQPEKWRTKIKEGWRKVAEIPGHNVPAREWVARCLAKLSGRSVAVSPTPVLIVLENPTFATNSDGALQGH
jgi:hypothetical protein